MKGIETKDVISPLGAKNILINKDLTISMADIYVYKVYTTFCDIKRKGLFAEDHNTGDEFMTCDAENMASQLRGNKARINYKGNRTEDHTFVDGYFGRPFYPADVYRLRRLYKREISELEREIDKAEAKLPKVNCI